MDDDSLEKLQESQIAEMMSSQGWLLAKGKLEEYISTLDNISSLPKGTNEIVGEEAKVRSLAVGAIRLWIEDLEGIKEGKLQDKDAVGETKDYIVNHD